MNSTYFVVFAAGVAVGVVTTMMYLRKYTRNVIEDNKIQLEEEYNQKLKQQEEKSGDIQKEAEKAMNNYSLDNNKPFTITEDEFEEIVTYDSDSLTLYKDNVLVYDYNDEVVKDIDSLIGIGNIPDRSTYDNDMFWVRNPVLEKDFEISMSDEEYKSDEDES